MSPNVTYSVSLESYHPYLPPQKVSKIPKIECIHSSLPRNEKSRFGSLRTLGVKIMLEKQILKAFTSYCMHGCPKIVYL
jgi:hypothetical protein